MAATLLALAAPAIALTRTVSYNGATYSAAVVPAARPDAKVAMYVLGEGKRQYVSRDFMVPPKPIDFGAFLVSRDLAPFFEQISTERLDPRFATASLNSSSFGAIIDEATADAASKASASATPRSSL